MVKNRYTKGQFSIPLSNGGIPLLLLSCLLLFAGCLDSETTEGESGVKVSLVKQVQIRLDSLTPYDIVPVVPWVSAGKTLLFLTNPWYRSVDVYNVQLGRLEKRLRPVKGGGEVGMPLLHTPRACVVKNLDSIFVFERASLADAVLINMEGAVLDDRPLKYFDHHVPAFFNHGGRILLFEDKLYFKNVSLDIDLFNLNSASNIPFCSVYDLQKHDFHYLPLYYPPSYLKRGMINFLGGIPQLEIIRSRGWMLVNWPAKSRLEVRSLSDFSLVDEFVAHIPRWGKTLLHAPIRSKSQYDEVTELEDAMSFVVYATVFYDQWRDLVYRLAFIPSEQLPPPDRMKDIMAIGQNKVGVVVLDSKGKLKGAAVFPENTYWPYTSFVGPEGLYLSKANIYRDDFSEDLLEYDVFVFEPAGERMREKDADPGN